MGSKGRGHYDFHFPPCRPIVPVRFATLTVALQKEDGQGKQPFNETGSLDDIVVVDDPAWLGTFLLQRNSLHVASSPLFTSIQYLAPCSNVKLKLYRPVKVYVLYMWIHRSLLLLLLGVVPGPAVCVSSC
eukprot:4208921-Amphidinium_carterae.1